MLVSDIMTTEVITTVESAPISKIAKIIGRERIHAIPVVDGANHVLGIITETDFFTKESANMVYIPQFIDFIKSRNNQENPERSKDALDALVHATAKDIMTIDCVTISPDASIEDLIRLIKKTNYNSFPVINEKGFLAGIVTVYDMIKIL